MRECEKCKNFIPEGMKICPHCGKLPPTLWPQFYLYAVLTIVAVVCAVYFRPFLSGPAIGEVSTGVLWVAMVIFAVFGLIFLGVCVIVARDYSHRSFREPLTKQERLRFVNMKQHIESNRHFYENDVPYCTVCGHRKPEQRKKK